MIDYNNNTTTFNHTPTNIYEKPKQQHANNNTGKINHNFMTMSKYKANRLLDKPMRNKGSISGSIGASTPADAPMPFYSIPLDPPEPFTDMPYNPPKRSASQRSSFNLMAFAEKCLQQYDQMRRRPHTEYQLNLSSEKVNVQKTLARSKTTYRSSKNSNHAVAQSPLMNDASIGHLIQWGQSQNFAHSGYEYHGEDAERERRNRLSQGAVSVASSQPIPNASQESLVQLQVPPNPRNTTYTTYTTYTMDDKRISLEPEICHIIQQHNQGLALQHMNDMNKRATTYTAYTDSTTRSKRESVFNRISNTMRNMGNRFYQHSNQALAEIVIDKQTTPELPHPNRALFRNSMQSPMPSLRQIDVSSSANCSIIEDTSPQSAEFEARAARVSTIPTGVANRDSGLFHRPESVSFLDKYPKVSSFPTWTSRKSTMYDRLTGYFSNQPSTFFFFYLGFLLFPLWWCGSLIIIKNITGADNIHDGRNRSFLFRSRCRYMSLATMFVGLIIVVGFTWVRPDWAGIRIS
ncbi:hypothetical protein CONCODRAFT_10151 [Conidiobolus coronatus NRRL 28638]|uniref:Uncharacterized protein n=1 Tax=Conidiobolus coronatus (strain ATCC 28846 / CBS 209.66 / NRRL 28638) TaxID=796925 RepID=A0A137NYA8_CONC2|nr:hypothetical protein CONCODRAFT_10151 [Conidiobolus coronatus NRRL 28638]|eukprot:KXN67737.1 hypothetical protein CONCODRAFT_10151 [Conidiobolus coronatus NRRL 28638]